jgi:hypothetical protein
MSAMQRTFVLILALGVLAPSAARAARYDISLLGLGDPATKAAQDRFKALSGELALVLAPRPMQPGETLGLSGFEVSVANSWSSISSGQAYWQGQPGSPILEGASAGKQVPGGLWTPTLHIRKGLPFSTEIGVQATYLSFSSLYMIGAEAKVAIHESYFRWFPSLAVRAAVGRLMGSSELDLLTLEADAVASLPFGVAGVARVTPYLGYGQMGVHANSYVLDRTPYVVLDPNDQRGSPGSLVTYPTINWYQNLYPRYFGGLRINTAIIELLYEANVGITSFGKKQVVTHTLKLGFDV